MPANEQIILLTALLGVWGLAVWLIVRSNRRAQERLRSVEDDPPSRLTGIWPESVRARYENIDTEARKRFWRRYKLTFSFVILPLFIACAVFGLVYQSIPAVIVVSLSILAAVAFAVSGR